MDLTAGDTVRVGIIAAAMLLAVLVVRLWWVRIKPLPPEERRLRVHPATAGSYLGLLGYIVAGGLGRLGDPLDRYTAAAAVLVGAGLYGVGSRAEFAYLRRVRFRRAGATHRAHSRYVPRPWKHQ